MIELTFYVPQSHLDTVKEAVFKAGAGRLGDYEYCSWQTLGEGQFRPLAGASPFIGSEGEIARVQEYRVTVVCNELELPMIIDALKQAHPYEEPAYGAVRLVDV